MTTTRSTRPHSLRRNKLERSPHRLLIIDSESQVMPDAWGDVTGYDLLGADRYAQQGFNAPAELQVLRCWVACLLHRHGHEGKQERVQWFDGQDAEQLATLVDRLTRRRETLWLFAHNLSYDLALTGLPLRLLPRGWVLGRHNLASDAPWAFLRRGRRALRLADSWSWLPAPVSDLGELLSLPKRELPAATDELAEWRERCRRDVEITTAALERLLDIWDQQRLGSWSLTGPASAWNTMLHKAPGQTIIIDPDPAARGFERLALYSGRRDLNRVGSFAHGPYVLLDLREAFAAVCAAKLLPVWRGAGFEALDLSRPTLANGLGACIASCTVTTPSPHYPVRLGPTIVHPTGTFQTVLAGPELEQAHARGELRAVGPGFHYHLGVRMQPWAQWLLTLLRDTTGRVDPILQVFLKQASRTVPGRWGMLIQREGERIRSAWDGWHLEPAVFGPTFTYGAWFHCNGEAVQLIRDQDGDDAFPAVLAFIQSWVRVALQALLDQLGEANWCQVNTDGAWVPERAANRMHDFNAAHWPFAVRVKATADTLELTTPQHWRADGRRSYAGIPAAARELTPQVFQFGTWPKLAGQMRRGDPRGYVRELRTVDLSHLPVTRWVAEDGCTRPPELTLGPTGANVLLGPPPLGCEAYRAPWRHRQHKVLGWHG